MPCMFVTELTSQSPMGSLKASAYYSAARDGRPCEVSSDVGARGWGTDDDDMATQEQKHAGLRNTYSEHVAHVRHRARVPARQVWVERCRVRDLREVDQVPEQLRHVRHTRRARPGELNFVRGSGSNQRIQSSPIALGVRDAVDDASVPHGGRWAEHGDAVVGEVKRRGKQLQRWRIIVR